MGKQTISGPTQTAVEGASNEWAPRPIVAGATRLAIFVFPYVVGFMLAIWMGRVFPAERLGINRFIWFVGVAIASTLVMIPADRLVRRLVPITGLLTVALGFPDAAPSRFKVAMRSTTTAQVRRRIEAALDANEVEGDLDRNQYLLDLVAVLTQHDRLTRGHSERVRAYSTLIGDELRLSKAEQQKLYWAALLHDIGKLDVPSEILNKAGRPDENEWKILQGHPAAADRYLSPLSGWLGEWSKSATQHHLRWDGKGYPSDLGGTDIALPGRIVAIADAYDVMTSARSYKKPLSAADARVELSRCAGGQFDPHLVRAFLNIGLNRVRLAGGVLASLPALVNAVLAPLASNGGRVLLATTAVTGGVAVAPLVDITPPEPVEIVVDFDRLAIVDGEPTVTPTVAATTTAIPTFDSASTGSPGLVAVTPAAVEPEASATPNPLFDFDLEVPDQNQTNGSTATNTSPAVTPTAGPPATAIATPTATATPTAIPTTTPTPGATPTTFALVIPSTPVPVQPTAAPTPRATSTALPTATAVATGTPVPVATLVPTTTPIPAPTSTTTALPSSTPVPTATTLPTATAVPTPTSTAVPTPTPTPAPTAAPLPTATSTPVPTATPLPTATSTPVPTATPLPTATAVPTPTSTAVPTPTSTPLPTPTATVIPTATATPLPSVCPFIAGCPTAEDDDYTFSLGERRNLKILENDLAPAGENLDEDTIEIIEFPQHDLDDVFRVHNDHVHYQAQPNYEGVDSFTYRVCATNGLCDEATVTITVSSGIPLPDLCSGFSDSTIRYSFDGSRRNSEVLDGSGFLLNDTFIYIFSTVPETTATVSYYFDDPDRLGAPFFVDDSCTYDATISGAGGQPTRAIQMSQIGSGFHAITIEVVDADGSVVIRNAVFGLLVLGDPLPTPTAVPTTVVAPTATPTMLPVPTVTPTAIPVPTPTAVPAPTPTPIPVPTPTPDPNAPTADCLIAQQGGSIAANADLSNCDLSGVIFPTGVDLSGADLTAADLTGTGLQGANLSGAILIDATLVDVNLQGANLNGADLSGADVSDGRLQDADLTDVTLVGARLEDTKLQDANLTRADLTGVSAEKIKLQGADLTDAILIDAHLKDARFGDANFPGAVLDGADLTEATFGAGDGTGAQFNNVLLVDAIFDSTDLAQASFAGANIDGLDFDEIDVTGATFLNAFNTPSDIEDTTFDNTTCPDGTITNDGCWA